MDDHERAELGRGRPHRLQRRIVEILAGDVGADHGAVHAELAHGALELLGGLLGRLHRQGRDPHEAIGMRLRELGDLVVLERGRRRGQRRVLVVEIGLRGRREHVHIDLGGVHVAEAALQLPAAARERPVGRARDLENREIGVDRGELRGDPGRLLGQQPDRLVGEDMGMTINGAGPGHRCPLCGMRGGARREVASCVRPWQACYYIDDRPPGLKRPLTDNGGGHQGESLE